MSQPSVIWEGQRMTKHELLDMRRVEEDRQQQESEARIVRGLDYVKTLDDMPMVEALECAQDEYGLSEIEIKEVMRRWGKSILPANGYDLQKLETAFREIEAVIDPAKAIVPVSEAELIAGLRTDYGAQVMRALRLSMNELRRAA